MVSIGGNSAASGGGVRGCGVDENRGDQWIRLYSGADGRGFRGHREVWFCADRADEGDRNAVLRDHGRAAIYASCDFGDHEESEVSEAETKAVKYAVKRAAARDFWAVWRISFSLLAIFFAIGIFRGSTAPAFPTRS